ncbi:MAG TPA: hypothetical protein VHO72_17370 [Bacteroidales bacterium]|nr:hypothetical protein [Bacteroidales bacterium]
MLTELDILTITETIDKAEISFSHLRDELIDHVCCEIECQMEDGANFQQAFSNIKTKIGIRELQIVQENTLLLIDKQYRIMKRLMKISGVLSLLFLMTGTIFRIFRYPASNILIGMGFLLLCFLFLPIAMSIMRKENKSNTKLFLFLSGYVGIIGFSLGTYFRLMHWPGTPILLSIGLLTLSFLFMPMLWVTLKRNLASTLEKTAVLIGIVAGRLFFVALLCKMMHWPGATILYLVSVTFLMFVFLPLYTYTQFKLSTYVNEKFIYIIYAFTWVILLSLLLNLNVQYNAFKVFEADAAAKISITEHYKSKSTENPVNADTLAINETKTVKLKVNEIDRIIENTKKDFITAANGDLPYDNNDITTIIQILANYHNYDRFQSILFDNSSPALVIAQKIKEVREYFLQHSQSKDQSAIVSVLLSTSIPENAAAKGLSWEKYQFMNKYPLAQYQILLGLQERLRIAEVEMMNGLK